MTAHAIQRARERYALELSMGDVFAMTRAIRAMRSFVLERRTEADGVKELHMVRHGEQQLPVVYHPASDRILTVLPPACEELKRWPPATWETRSLAMRTTVLATSGFLARGTRRASR